MQQFVAAEHLSSPRCLLVRFSYRPNSARIRGKTGCQPTVCFSLGPLLSAYAKPWWWSTDANRPRLDKTLATRSLSQQRRPSNWDQKWLQLKHARLAASRLTLTLAQLSNLKNNILTRVHVSHLACVSAMPQPVTCWIIIKFRRSRLFSRTNTKSIDQPSKQATFDTSFRKTNVFWPASNGVRARG